MSKKVDFKESFYKYLDIEKLNLPLDAFYYKDKDEKSIWFKGKNGYKPVDYLREVFDTEKAYFDKKFDESVSGDGNEAEKNYAIKSSSLCALLFFYKVSKHPITFKGIEYTKVYFEVKNIVTTRESNMDVVLVGKKDEEDDSVLFIESKFSEFVEGSTYPLGKTYRAEPYWHMFNNDIFQYNNNKVFQYGLKQLITHYIGIRNFLNSDLESYKKKMAALYKGKIGDRISVYKKYKNVGFLEIVFDMPDEENYKKYIEETKLVFASLEEERKKDNLEMNLYGTTTYQKFFVGKNKEILDKVVKDFYLVK